LTATPPSLSQIKIAAIIRSGKQNLERLMFLTVLSNDTTIGKKSIAGSDERLRAHSKSSKETAYSAMGGLPTFAATMLNG
jgi:hypothetical protein